MLNGAAVEKRAEREVDDYYNIIMDTLLMGNTWA